MITLSDIVNLNQPHIPDFTDPIGLLERCHDKITTQLGALERALEILREGDRRLAVGAFTALEMACAHFANPGVKHTEDEEVSLFPRLRASRTAAGEDALAAMAELESQHRRAEALHAQFDQLFESLPRDGSAERRTLDLLSDQASELSSLYRPHIMLENQLVFPTAARILQADELRLLGEEMRARRFGARPRTP